MSDIDKHYKEIGGSAGSAGIEPIEYIMANNLNFNEGNVIKYVSRHKYKGNGADDILKAIDYCKFILKYEYGIDFNNLNSWDCSNNE